MSVIGKEPYVNYIINACNKTQVNRVVSLMNNFGEPINVALYGQDNLLSEEYLGVNFVSLAMDQLTMKIIKGILVYLDNDHCGFFGVATNSDIIEEFRIDPVTKMFFKIREYLTVEELRQICGDRVTDVEIEYVKVEGIGKVFRNVSATNWESDSTYEDYGYKCDLTCTGITANSIVEVIFDMDEATSGDYAPVCSTSANTVTIYAKVDDSITIPVIKEIA